jgi:hypothetical protein
MWHRAQPRGHRLGRRRAGRCPEHVLADLPELARTACVPALDSCPERSAVCRLVAEEPVARHLDGMIDCGCTKRCRVTQRHEVVRASHEIDAHEEPLPGEYLRSTRARGRGTSARRADRDRCDRESGRRASQNTCRGGQTRAQGASSGTRAGKHASRRLESHPPRIGCCVPRAERRLGKTHPASSSSSWAGRRQYPTCSAGYSGCPKPHADRVRIALLPDSRAAPTGARFSLYLLGSCRVSLELQAFGAAGELTVQLQLLTARQTRSARHAR